MSTVVNGQGDTSYITMRTLYDALECSGPMTIAYLLKFFPAIGQANLRGNNIEEIRIMEKRTPRLKPRPLPVLWPDSDDDQFLQQVEQVESTSFVYQNDTPPTTDKEDSIYTDSDYSPLQLVQNPEAIDTDNNNSEEDPDSQNDPETDGTITDNNNEDDEDGTMSTEDENAAKKTDDDEDENAETDEQDGTGECCTKGRFFKRK